MDAGNLNTTNLLLGILAAVAVLEGIVLVGAAVLGYRLYTKAMATVQTIEQRQVAPLAARAHEMMTRLDSILVDVKDVTGRVSDRTERVDSAIRRTTTTVSSGVGPMLTLVHTARAAVDSLLHQRRTA